MKLWHLTIPDDEIDHNRYDEFVIWARTEEEARQLASDAGGDNHGIWLRPEATCVPFSLVPPSEPTIVLGSFWHA